MSAGLVILDRDGVINRDSPDFIKSLAEWIPIPGSLDAIATLKRAGYRVGVATNQSGLARGLFDKSALDAMHQRLHALLAERECELDMLVYCPHGPDDGCDCRKPRPGLYRQIGAQLNQDLRQAIVVGDSKRDLEAAAAVGACPVLVLTGKGAGTLENGGLPGGTRVFDDLAAVARALASGDFQSTAPRASD